MKYTLLRLFAVVLFLGLWGLVSCNTSETGPGEDTHIEEALGEQIRILGFNKSKFFLSTPSFELFFTLNCISYVFKFFKI